MEENIAFGLPRIIEIPADILLYWTLKNRGFKGSVSETDLDRYHEALCKAREKYKNTVTEALAFNYPYGNNYAREIFEEAEVNGKTVFRIRQAQDKRSKQLLELRLARLESFGKMQRKDVQTMFVLAEQFYRMKQPQVTYTVQQEPTIKKKILSIAVRFKKKNKKK